MRSTRATTAETARGARPDDRASTARRDGPRVTERPVAGTADAPKAPDASAATSTHLAASVIVPTYRDRESLAGCLACLARQDFPAERFEIVVADNDPEAARSPPSALPANARLVHQPTPGSYAARNAAAAGAGGAVLFFTDADCRPAPDWIASGLRLLEENPAVDRLGGAVVLSAAGARWTVPELYDRLFNLRQERYVGRGYAATANLVVRRELFERVGPFDERLYSSGDKEWNRRAGAAGSRLLYADTVRVEHPARASFAEHARKRARVVQGRLALRRERGANPWLALPKYLLPSAGAALRIARAPSLTLAERLALLAFDYRLRLHELRTTVALLRGSEARYRL